jgi:hypothetical protein
MMASDASTEQNPKKTIPRERHIFHIGAKAEFTVGSGPFRFFSILDGVVSLQNGTLFGVTAAQRVLCYAIQLDFPCILVLWVAAHRQDMVYKLPLTDMHMEPLFGYSKIGVILE